MTRRSIAAVSLLVAAACWPSKELSSYSRAGASDVGAAGADDAGLGQAPPGSAPSPLAPRRDAGAPGASPAGGGGASGDVVSEVVSGPGGGDLALPDAGPPALDAAAPGEAAATICEAPGLPGPAGSCYRTVALQLSWADARESCRAIGPGWDLAESVDAADNEFLGAAIEAESWIGASDALMEGVWRWARSGVPFWIGGGSGRPVQGAFTRWNATEPNGGANSDCARMLPALPGAASLRGTWADLECEQLRGSICELYD